MEQNKHDEQNLYLEERKELVISERETASQFDKAILTLAAGALALSVTFINYIAPTPKPYSICFLIIAWVFFSFSILSTLISFLTSQAACRKQREILDAEISNKSTPGKNLAAIWTNWLNYVSIILFIIGVIFLLIFSAVNLWKGDNVMDKEEKKDQAGYVPPERPAKPGKPMDEGYVPPKPPVKPPDKPADNKK